MKMSESYRLHPISALINTLRQLKELIIPVILFVIFGSRGENTSLYYFIFSAVGLLVVLTLGVLRWYRFTYRIEEGELRIEHGLFIRKKRFIPFERIQSLDVSEGIFHRPFGLVQVKVETAGGSESGEAEAVLTAITKDDADKIHQMLVSLKKSNQLHERGVEGEELIYKISAGELLLLASTSGGVGVVLSASVAFILQFEEFIPYETLFKELESFISHGVILISVLVFIGFFLAWFAAIVGTMVRYAGFTIKKIENDVIITRGLLERKQLTIPLHRIQAIRVSENLIRQPLGLASVYVESAGGSAMKENSSQVLVLPLIRKGRIAPILDSLSGGYDLNVHLLPAPRRAFPRYVMKGWLLMLPFIVVPIGFFNPWGYLALLLLPASTLWSIVVYKDAGWGMNHRMLTLRFRAVVKHTVYMKREKIQALNVNQSYFQEKKNLATVEAIVKSGHGGAGGKVIDLDNDEIAKIYRWYSNE